MHQYHPTHLFRSGRRRAFLARSTALLVLVGFLGLPAARSQNLPLATAGASAEKQNTAAPPLTQEVATAVAELSAQSSTLNTQQIQERIQRLESVTDGDAVTRTRLLELYRQILQRAETERTSLEKSEAFRTSIETAPSEITRIRAQISALESTVGNDPIAALPPETTAEQAQSQLTQEQSLLTSLKTRQSDLEKRVAAEEARPPIARTQLTEARTILAQIEIDLAAAPAASEGTETEQAQRSLLEIRQRARLAEIRMLEQELLSNAIRVSLLSASRDLGLRQAAIGETRIKAFETKVSELRQTESERARIEAEQLRREAIGKHQLIRTEAEEINQITQETQGLTPLIDKAVRSKGTTQTELELIKADLDEAEQTLKLGNITESVGAVLLEQRRSLRGEQDLETIANEITGKKSIVSLRLFKIERQLRQLGDIERTAEQLLIQATELPADESGRRDLSSELGKMLGTKRGHLEQLAQALRAYKKELLELETAHEAMVTQTAQMALILDENLLWIHNAPALGWRTPIELGDQLHGLVREKGWTSSLQGIRDDATNALPTYITFTLLLIGLLASRRGIIRRLEAQAAIIGKVGEDNIGVTVRALILTLLVSLPVAILLQFAGWRLSLIQVDLAKATGTAAMVSGLTFFTIRFVRAVCRPSGLGEVHFRWNVANLRLVRRHLNWFLPVATISSFLVAFTESLADPLYRNTLGRIAFIILMIAASTLAHLILHRVRGLVLDVGKNAASTWTTRTRPLWQPATILLPLLLAVLAGMGYYYTAVAFEYRLNQSVTLVLSAAGAYALLYRWLNISQRRLALKIAVEKRQALLRSREAGEENEAEGEHSDFHEEIDVIEVKTQTVELLRMSMALLLILGLWFTWSGVMPAFRVLDRVQLWDHVIIVDGQETTSAITLSNLALSVVIVVVTVLAARNMPGFLEIALLQRLPVDRGTRYAIRTLVLYAIVSLGIALAFNAIGIGWSSVQWLVAALTVGLGFGLQEIFGNFVSGLIILLERPIRVGDTVTVGSISGVVTQIRMRATTITDWNRKELVVPNKSFITGELINWSLSDPILRMDFSVGIAYGSDTTLAQQTMLKVCKEHPMVLDQPEPTVFFTGFGDNTLNFDARVFVTETNNTARTRVVHDLHMAVDAAFREHGICIAFPQRDIHLDTLKPLEVHVKRLDRPRED